MVKQPILLKNRFLLYSHMQPVITLIEILTMVTWLSQTEILDLMAEKKHADWYKWHACFIFWIYWNR